MGDDAGVRLFASQVFANEARGEVQALGGGIYVADGGWMRATVCLIFDNAAVGVDGGEGFGGGVFIDDASSGWLRWNWIFDNEATTDGDNVFRL